MAGHYYAKRLFDPESIKSIKTVHIMFKDIYVAYFLKLFEFHKTSGLNNII